jgi:hypothetical protein
VEAKRPYFGHLADRHRRCYAIRRSRRFRGAVDEGVVALQKAGADVVLVNLQYSPRTETMISAPPT